MKMKQNSKVLDKAQARAERLEAIDPKLDLGHGITVEKFVADIAAVRKALNDSNEALTTAMVLRADFQVKEVALAELCSRMLQGVSTAFGSDSVEYSQAGGKRRSERAHPKRESKKTD